jgi:hypothetical protein
MSLRRNLCLLGIAALVLTSNSRASQSQSPPPQTPPADSKNVPQPTIITLAPSGGNNVQLGIQVNGSFRYPFAFAWNAPASLGLSLSPSGAITGTSTQTSDTNVTITVTDSAAKTIASYPVTLHVGTATVVMLGSAPAANDAKSGAAKASIIPNSIYEGGDTISGTLVGGSASNSSDPKASGPGSCSNGGAITTLSVQRNSEAGAKTSTDCNGAFSYQFNAPLRLGDSVTVGPDPSAGASAAVVPALRPPQLFGEELRAIVGYEQAGASSSDFHQSWFLDFYISRPLAFPTHQDAKKSLEEGDHHYWRWWGNVRIASFAQPGNQTLAELATGFTAQLGALKLNQLAQGAEFLSGVEFAPFHSFPFRGLSENTRQSFTLGFVAGFGATGFFSSPSSNVQVFFVPGAGTPALAAFQSIYGNVTTQRVGFIAPDVQRFPKQFLGGLRLTTHYFDPSGMPLTSAPAMLQITAGQNQVISGGRWQGVIGRIEAFYPLPFGNRGHSVAGAFSSVYLFGQTELRIGAARVPPALVLQADTSTPAYDPSVTLVPSPTTRDTYRFGFGLDLVGFISQLTGGSEKSAATAAAQASAGAQAKPAPPPAAPPANP